MGRTIRWHGLLSLAAIVMPLAAQTQVVLHDFGNTPPRGGQPNGVVKDTQGNLWGTAAEGGYYSIGVLFKIDAAGHETVLHNFGAAYDGFLPVGSLLLDSAGNLYGATIAGGTMDQGTIFKLDAGGNYSVLYNFTDGADGNQPTGSLAMDAEGDLYGTSHYGGVWGGGVAFKLDTSSNLTVLHSFGEVGDGSWPNGGLVLDPAGNIYGTTYTGGQGDCIYDNGGCGIVFRISPDGGVKVIYSFTTLVGTNPKAGVIRDAAGNLYGTTSAYGGNEYYGDVYEISPGGQHTVLHSFTRKEGAGFAGLVRDPSGNLYGNTPETIFEIDKGGHYKELYEFSPAPKGLDAYAGMMQDAQGNLHGATYAGGPDNAGVIYEWSASGAYSVIYSFRNQVPISNGANGTFGGLARDAAGNLYGTSFGGGVGFGTIYKLDAGGHETVLFSFSDSSDGGYPWSGVTLDAAGNLYGTAQYGADVNGVVYKLDASGQYSVLYTFTGGVDGGAPYAPVTLDSAGYIYGTTSAGGAANAGVVFEVDPSGNERVLYSFTGGSDGGRPFDGGLVLDNAGNIYGATAGGGPANAGVIFKLDASGHETVLYTFTGGADGGFPQGIVRDPQGEIYGTAYSGGTANAGVVFMIDTARHETVLYNFTGGADGMNPGPGLVRGEGGVMFGTTFFGGASNLGVVFSLDASGQETVLHSFSGADGAYPRSGLIRDAAGNLYGTASTGGERGGGVAFKTKPL